MIYGIGSGDGISIGCCFSSADGVLFDEPPTSIDAVTCDCMGHELSELLKRLKIQLSRQLQALRQLLWVSVSNYHALASWQKPQPVYSIKSKPTLCKN